MNLYIHSDDSQTIDICKQYWNRSEEGVFESTVSAIAANYGLSVHDVGKIVKKNCEVYSSIIKCITCNKPRIYSSRQNFKDAHSCNTLRWSCQNCKKAAEQAKEDEEVRTRAKVLKIFQDAYTNAEPVKVKDLSIRQAIFLYALILHSAAEDLSYIRNVGSNIAENLSSSFIHGLIVINELLDSKLIVVEPDSATDQEFEGEIVHPWLVESIIPLSESNGGPAFTKELEGKIRSMEFVESSYDELIELCKEVSLHETFAFLEHMAKEHNLPIEIGEKTQLVLVRVLENYTVAQTYNFIWRACKNAAAFSTKSGITLQHAANTIPGSIERYMLKAMDNGWEITPYKRNYNLRQSIVSQVLFGTLLHTDDGGFNKPLREII